MSLIITSKLKQYPAVNLSACQVIRNGVLLVAHVGNPVITIYIVHTKQVQAIYAQPDVLEDNLLLPFVVVQQTVAHAYVGAFVGRSTEGVVLYSLVGSGEGQTIGKRQF